jgi:serine protein kinase
MAAKSNPKALSHHLNEFKKGKRIFEDAFQGVSRMILDAGIQKITVKGKTTYQFDIFNQGKKHLVGMYDEINSFVSFVKDASE